MHEMNPVWSGHSTAVWTLLRTQLTFVVFSVILKFPVATSVGGHAMCCGVHTYISNGWTHESPHYTRIQNMAAPKCLLCHLVIENDPSYQYHLASGETRRMCVACHLRNVQTFDPGQYILVQQEQQGLQLQIATVEERMKELDKAQARLDEERHSLVPILVDARKGLGLCTSRVQLGQIAQTHPQAEEMQPWARPDLLAFLMAGHQKCGEKSYAGALPVCILDKITRMLLCPTNMQEELKNCATIMREIGIAKARKINDTNTMLEICHHFEMVENCNHETRCYNTTLDQCDKLAEALDLHDYYVRKSLRHAVFGYDFDCFPLNEKKPFVHKPGELRPRRMRPFYTTASCLVNEYMSQLVTLRPSTPLPLMNTGLLARIIAVAHKNEAKLWSTDKIEPKVTPAMTIGCHSIPPNFHYIISPQQTMLCYIYNVSDDDLLLQPDSIDETTTIEHGSLITKQAADVVRHAVMADSFGKIANLRQPDSRFTPQTTLVRDANGNLILTISICFQD